MSYRTDLKARFDKCDEDDEYIQFDRIESPRHPRPDVCAFLMLHEICGGEGDIIGSSEHDEFYLSVDCETLHKNATDEQIRDLVRCGVMYNKGEDCLSMFS